MNVKIIASISGAAIMLIAIALVGYNEVYQERCINDGGSVTGFLNCAKVYRDFTSAKDVVFSKYGVEYNDIVTREAKAIAWPAVETIPERNCHKFTQDDLENLPEIVTDAMTESSDEFKNGKEDDGDGFFSGYQKSISFDDALYLLENYDFQLTTHKFEGSYPKQQDVWYAFECIIEYDSHQYKIEIRFDTHYNVYGRLVFVNFTKDDSGISVLDNDNLTLYAGGFNQTVVFKNNLDHDITLEITNPKLPEEHFQRGIPEETTIPAGKVWSYFFRKDSPVDVLVYQFTAMPDNLRGVISLKGYPGCMTKNEAVSLYGQVGAYPKFPSYIPEGYSFECGIHNFNSNVYLAYWNDDLREKFKDRINDSNKKEFFASCGIVVEYYNGYILNNWNADPDYDKYKIANESDENNLDSSRLSIAGEPAVFVKKHFWENGEQKSYNELLIYLDGEIWYRIVSGLPESEVIKIAESLFVS